MSNCEHCNTEIDSEPIDAYGGDWHSSCHICEWYSESEEKSRIKQGLTLEELVEHKARLNSVYNKIHTLRSRARSDKGAYQTREMLDKIMEELSDLMKQLLESE